MIKKVIVILVLALLSLQCSKPMEKQNLDISITGKVTNQNNVGIAGVTVYIQRGPVDTNYGPSYYNNYATTTTNSSGNYSYLITSYDYEYEVCCGVPTGYTGVDPCKQVDKTITNSHTVPNVINFKLH